VCGGAACYLDDIKAIRHADDEKIERGIQVTQGGHRKGNSSDSRRTSKGEFK
jgi:hypothetical protein